MQYIRQIGVKKNVIYSRTNQKSWGKKQTRRLTECLKTIKPLNDKVDAIHSKPDMSKKDFVTQNIILKDSFKMYP